MRQKEVFRDGLRIKLAGDNCLVSVASCALGELGKADWDPDLLRALLTMTNQYYLKIVSRCLEAETGMRFEAKIIPNLSSVVRNLLIEKLDKGSLCELRVRSTGWIGNIMNHETRDIKKDELHSVMVFGYYAPLGPDCDLWLYLADSYSEKLWFLPLERVYGILEKGSRASIGVFTSVQKANGAHGRWGKFWLNRDELEQVKKIESARDKLIIRPNI